MVQERTIIGPTFAAGIPCAPEGLVTRAADPRYTTHGRRYAVVEDQPSGCSATDAAVDLRTIPGPESAVAVF